MRTLRALGQQLDDVITVCGHEAPPVGHVCSRLCHSMCVALCRCDRSFLRQTRTALAQFYRGADKRSRLPEKSALHCCASQCSLAHLRFFQWLCWRAFTCHSLVADPSSFCYGTGRGHDLRLRELASSNCRDGGRVTLCLLQGEYRPLFEPAGGSSGAASPPALPRHPAPQRKTSHRGHIANNNSNTDLEHQAVLQTQK